MPRRRPGTGSRSPARRSALDNPYDTDPGTPGPGSIRALQVLTGAALATGAAMAVHGTAAADVDDLGPSTSEVDGGIPDTSGTDVFAPEVGGTTPGASSDTLLDTPSTTAAAPSGNDGAAATVPDPLPTTAGAPDPPPDPATGPSATDVPPPTAPRPGPPPAPGTAGQLPATGTDLPVDPGATEVFGTSEGTAAADTFVLPPGADDPAAIPGPTAATTDAGTPVPAVEQAPSTSREPTGPATPTDTPPTSPFASDALATPATDTALLADTALVTEAAPGVATALVTDTTHVTDTTPATDTALVTDTSQVTDTALVMDATDTALITDTAPEPGLVDLRPPTPPEDPAEAGHPSGRIATTDLGDTSADDTLPPASEIVGQGPPSPDDPLVDDAPGDATTTDGAASPDLVLPPAAAPTSPDAGRGAPDPVPGPWAPVQEDLPPGTPEPVPAATEELPSPSTTGTPDTATGVLASTGPGNEPDDDTTWVDDELSRLLEGSGGTRAIAGSGGPRGSLPDWALDGNIAGYPGTGFPLRATEIHPAVLPPDRSPWFDHDLPKTPEEIAQDEQRVQWLYRETAKYQFGGGLGVLLGVPFSPREETFLEPTEVATPEDGGAVVDGDTGQGGGAPQGAERTAAQLFDIWQRQHDRDLRGEGALPLTGITPQAMNTYICLTAVRCPGAPPGATIHAGAALAELLHSNGELTDRGLVEVRTAAHDGLQNLREADRVAATYLPDARLTITGDPVLDRTIGLANRIAPNDTVADLIVSRFRSEAHPAGSDGTPRTRPVPGSPIGLGDQRVSSRNLLMWDDWDISPVELASMEGLCQEMARLVCETDYRIDGSSAGPNVEASPERRESLAALNRALGDYWARWRAEPESSDTFAAWLAVMKAQEDLDTSIRTTGRPVPGASGAAQTTAQTSAAQTPAAQASTAQPGRVAQLTSDAQLGVLEALHRNVPSHTGPDGTPPTLAEFAAALLGPGRMRAGDQTFRIPDAPSPTVPGAPGGPQVSATSSSDQALPGPAGDRTDTVPSPDDPTSSPTPSPGGGVVFAPEKPRWNPDLDPNLPGTDPRPEPAGVADDRPTPPVRVDLPPLGGFGDGPRPEEWSAHTGSPAPDTAGLAMPVTRFPVGPEDLDDAPEPARTPPAPPRTIVAPIPSDTAGRRVSPALTDPTGPATTGPVTSSVTDPVTTDPAPPVRTGPPASRPGARYPLCGSGISTRCVDPSTLYDLDDDGVADNDGIPVLGARTVGPELVGPGLVGPGLVGPGLVGPGPSTAAPTPIPPPTARPRGTTDPARPAAPRPVAPSPAAAARPVTARQAVAARPVAARPVTARQAVAAGPVAAGPVTARQATPSPAAAPRQVTPQPAARPRPVAAQAAAARPVAQPGLLERATTSARRAVSWGRETVGNAVGQVQRVLADIRAGSRELARMTIDEVEAVDGSLISAPTRYRVELGDGTVGIYSADGPLVEALEGDPPPSVSAAQLRARGLFPGGGAFPGRSGPGQPALQPVPIRVR